MIMIYDDDYDYDDFDSNSNLKIFFIYQTLNLNQFYISNEIIIFKHSIII